MTGVRWALHEAWRNLRHGGASVLLELLARGYFGRVRSAEGTPPFERDWDLLVVLDACRADVLAEVAGEYAFLDDPGTVTSVGATSTEWLRESFGPAADDTLAGTTVVTGNPYSRSCLDADRIGTLDEVWRYAWDDDLGTIRPRPLTDRAIAHAREAEPDRLVVHYMQPHFPSIPEPAAEDGIALGEFGDEPIQVWEDLRFGRRDEETAWAHYRENLRYVLDEVALLLDNVDADRVAITADHGNAFGEWSLYGHAEGVALPCLREVPWYLTEATDEETHEPREYEGMEDAVLGGEGGGESAGGEDDRDTDPEDEVAKRLEQLGYR